LSDVSHPYRNVAIAGVFNTVQARSLPGHSSLSIAIEAAHGALADAGLTVHDVDGLAGQFASEMGMMLGRGPVSRKLTSLGIPAIIDAAAMIALGECEVVVAAAGGAGIYTERSSTAPWTRPTNEFVASYGLFTAAEFALIARRHMVMYGTTEQQLATVAATIRNNGHVNPGAVFSGKGPFTADDVLASRMVADPFHLLDCSMVSEGGCALVLVHADRVKDLRTPPAWILGAAGDLYGPAYQVAPSFDLGGRGEFGPNGVVGRRAAQISLRMGGLRVDDVDVGEFYDPFSFEIIRQLEAFGFCGEGEGGAFVDDGNIGPGGRLPVTTDGGTMSFSHAGINAQQFQRVIRGVEQIRGTCQTMQVPDAHVALCTNGGAGALFTDVMVIGKERP